jgi:Na+/H+ antiporter NhaD/arsenite permease-like protein
MTAHAASHVIFGLNPMWVSTLVLVTTYAIIISEKVNRAIVALLGACVMIVVGVLDQAEAVKGVDFNTIGLLTGMMILVSVSRRCGMFQYVALWSAQAAKAHPKLRLQYCRPCWTMSPPSC